MTAILHLATTKVRQKKIKVLMLKPAVITTIIRIQIQILVAFKIENNK